jgi:hypothetical protein
VFVYNKNLDFIFHFRLTQLERFESEGYVGKCCGLLMAVFVSTFAMAAPSGPGGSGGGDPQAIEFLMLSDQVSGWLRGNDLLPMVDRRSFQSQADRLRKSLDVPYEGPYLIFTDDSSVLCDVGGRKIPKVACTVSGEVTVNRNVWVLLTLAQKFELVSQEIFVLMGIENNRYSMAQVIGEHADEIGVQPPPMSSLVIVSVTGASGVVQDGESTTIYAGMAGPSCGANCNSCAVVTCGTAPFCACNTNRIGDSSPVSISFISDQTDVTKRVAIFNQANVPIVIGGRYAGAGRLNTISTTWLNLCLAAGEVGTCEGSNLDSIFRVGLTDGSQMFPPSLLVHLKVLAPTTDTIDDCTSLSGSLCGFSVEGGSRRIFMTSLMGDQSYPGETSMIRVFVSDRDFEHANLLDALRIVDMPVAEDGSVQNAVIWDLPRLSVPYHLRVATVDRAGNMYNFISDTNIKTMGRCMFPMDTNPTDSCRYHATPTN